MESEDRVVSEVLNYSKTEKIKNKDGYINEVDSDFYTCFLGNNGQVILWNELTETVLSRFEFCSPNLVLNENLERLEQGLKLDADGDLDVVRKNSRNVNEGILLIEHQNSTTLDLVGEQLWNGALFLADFVIHCQEKFAKCSVLELASGVGLTSIITAMFASKVIITDVNKGIILDLVKKNLERNKEIVKADVLVEEIDFCNLNTVDNISDKIHDVEIILAADVVYHNDLTDAFFNTVLKLMSQPPNKTLYIALEKRFVFTIEDLDTVAPCYEYFLQRLQWLTQQHLQQVQWKIDLLQPHFQQYFAYEKSKHLVLWRIQAKLV